jgi:hypothetical protein
MLVVALVELLMGKILVAVVEVVRMLQILPQHNKHKEILVVVVVEVIDQEVVEEQVEKVLL